MQLVLDTGVPMRPTNQSPESRRDQAHLEEALNNVAQPKLAIPLLWLRSLPALSPCSPLLEVTLIPHVDHLRGWLSTWNLQRGFRGSQDGCYMVLARRCRLCCKLVQPLGGLGCMGTENAKQGLHTFWIRPVSQQGMAPTEKPYQEVRTPASHP